MTWLYLHKVSYCLVLCVTIWRNVKQALSNAIKVYIDQVKYNMYVYKYLYNVLFHYLYHIYIVRCSFLCRFSVSCWQNEASYMDARLPHAPTPFYSIYVLGDDGHTSRIFHPHWHKLYIAIVCVSYIYICIYLYTYRSLVLFQHGLYAIRIQLFCVHWTNVH